PSCQNLSFYFANCRSIRNVIDTVTLLLVQRKLDILALSETWLSSSDCDAYLLRGLRDYFVFRADRIDSRGGGVLIYTRSTLLPVLVSSLIIPGYECTTIDIYSSSSSPAKNTFPTRGKNILDLALCNSPLVKSAKPDIPLSDHVGISLSISFETTLGEKLKPTRNYLFANWDMINSQIAMHNWTIALSNKTATEAYCYFSEFLNSLLDIFVPIKRGKSSSGYPKYLSQLHDRLHKLHQVAPNCDTTHSLRVRFDNALKSFELKRESNAVNSKNPNHFFQFCKSRFKVNTSSLPGIIDSNGNVLLTNKDKATAFSKFFSKVQTPPSSPEPKYHL
ncbi:hypothetical protein PMAYCL1PPCAC_00017, partial [Pristionchus mayeri]